MTPKHSSAPEPKQQSRGNQSDFSLVSASPQQIVARLEATLKQVDRLPVLADEAGAHLLYALDYLDKIRDAIRERMREAIFQSPGLVPGWHVEVVTIKKLCRDKEGKP